jgi:dipeptidyl aminopeptidase/acylaminoacyl peptidase
MHRRLQESPLRAATTAGLTIVVLALALLLAACGPTPTPQILVVTATFTPAPQVVVVTATDTPASAVQVVTATFTPVPEVVPSDTPLPTPTDTPPLPTATQPPPTSTPTPLPPTDTPTPLPATNTPKPEPSNTPTPKPTAKPTSLKSYFVVYTAFKGPDLYNYSLWGMNGDGSGAFRVDGAGQASEPAFSPDGSKFAFYHWTDGLYIWNLDKQTSRRVVDNTESSFPTWAPDNLRLAYANLYGQPWLHIVNADGSNDRQLTLGLRPSWSLKGGFIAYDTCENNKCGIFRINPDGGGKRQLTQDSGGGAAVSPNGNRIAYWSQADGDFEIYAINADGSGKVQLTNNQGNDALPAWSPDGKVIYYLSDQNGKGWAIMAMNADGSDKRKIVTTAAGNDPRRGWQYQRITVTWNE